MLYIKKTSPTLWIIPFFLGGVLSTLCPAHASENAGTIIPDIEAYPFFKHSQLSESTLPGAQTTITLETSSSTSATQLTAILQNWKLPFEVLSESPFIIKTNWLLWHYDEDTKKTLSEPQNNFSA